jgi:hypothetical protein
MASSIPKDSCSLSFSAPVWRYPSDFFSPIKKPQAIPAVAAYFSKRFDETGNPPGLFVGMLVVVDFLALAVGFPIQLSLILFGQVAVVFRHVGLLVVFESLLTLFEIGGLPRSQLVILFAIGDAVLLILLALIDLIHAGMSGINLSGAGARSVVLLRSSGSNPHQTAHCKNCK